MFITYKIRSNKQLNIDQDTLELVITRKALILADVVPIELQGIFEEKDPNQKKKLLLSVPDNVAVLAYRFLIFSLLFVITFQEIIYFSFIL